MKHYKYKVSGITGNGRPWSAEGMLSGSAEGFGVVPNAAMAASYRMLSEREAANKDECRGPYTIHRMVIEEVFTTVVLEPGKTRQ